MQHRNLLATAFALLTAAAVLVGCSDFSTTPAMRGNWIVQPMNLPKAQQAKPGGTFVTTVPSLSTTAEGFHRRRYLPESESSGNDVRQRNGFPV